ncbi:MAG: hypothetical protein EHM47_13760 [Ignavibacteriales bacterium]|nr:MAG: hypothetical protein EHM47_13760 [Ignavibacteriales bacterium]
MNKINSHLEKLKSEQEMFLNYLRAKFPLFHKSNFFFRDLHYGIKSYFEKKGNELSYPLAEQIAQKYAQHLEEEKIFVKINDKAWRVDFPEFVTTVPGDPL